MVWTMIRYAIVSLLVFNILICQVDSYETSFNFVNPQENRKLIGYELYQLNSLTEIKCLMKCAPNNKCHSINHHEGNKICILNNHEGSDSITYGGISSDDKSTDSLLIRDGWKFFKKTEVPSVKIPNQSSSFKIQGEIKPEENKLLRILPVVTEQWRIQFEVFLTELADVSTGVLAFYQNGTMVFQMTIIASQPTLVVTFGSKNITVSGLTIGAWNQILVKLKYELNSDVLLLQAYFEATKVGEVAFVVGVNAFRNVSVYLSQHGLRPMHGQIRDLEFIDSIERINDAPICYEAKDSKYGEFRLKRNFKIKAIRLRQVSGGLICSELAELSYWGCYIPGNSRWTSDKICTVVTDSQNNVVFPGSPFTDMEFLVPGYEHKTKSLILEANFGTKSYIGSEDEIMRIWYSDDLLNLYESNNSGEICVDVDVIYSADDE